MSAWQLPAQRVRRARLRRPVGVARADGNVRAVFTSVASRKDRAPYAKPWRVSDLDDCYFYHSIDLPESGDIAGDWDLRPGVDAYLGGIELADRRVLEIGPANGYLTFHMERLGAEVVAVEVSEDFLWDFVPYGSLDMDAVVSERMQVMGRVKNAFWLAHRELGARARVHYGSAYELPDGLGRFDVAMMGAVLLHNRDPLRIVANCAARADHLVIVDSWLPELAGTPLARLEPSCQNASWGTWWRFSPDLFRQFLEVLGFERFALSQHHQRAYGQDVPLFTLVASRR